MGDLPKELREAFKRKRYGAGEYDPDFDLLDAAADEIARLRGILRSCHRGAEPVDIGNGEIIGLYLPNKDNPTCA